MCVGTSGPRGPEASLRVASASTTRPLSGQRAHSECVHGTALHCTQLNCTLLIAPFAASATSTAPAIGRDRTTSGMRSDRHSSRSTHHWLSAVHRPRTAATHTTHAVGVTSIEPVCASNGSDRERHSDHAPLTQPNRAVLSVWPLAAATVNHLSNSGTHSACSC